MVIPPGMASPPTIYLNPSHDGRPFSDRGSSRTPIPLHNPSGAMSIPHARQDVAPPPLPPPQYIGELAHGHDAGWQWGNSGTFGRKELAPIKPGSSLYGGYKKRQIEEREEEMGGSQWERRESTITVKSPSGREIKREWEKQNDEGYHSLSGSSLINLRLVC